MSFLIFYNIFYLVYVAWYYYILLFFLVFAQNIFFHLFSLSYTCPNMRQHILRFANRLKTRPKSFKKSLMHLHFRQLLIEKDLLSLFCYVSICPVAFLLLTSSFSAFLCSVQLILYWRFSSCIAFCVYSIDILIVITMGLYIIS